MSSGTVLPMEAGSEFQEATIGELGALLRAGELTVRELTEAYLTRIDALDRSGPTLRSVIETNPDALAIADALDAELRDGLIRGPLHGMPILVKDNIDTADGMKTTAGSLALVDARPAADAPLISNLRDAGALLLGKSNLSEWANFRSTRSSSGWSARGGQCRNPYALDRNPGGSSSGSGVAVAASLCVAAVGTETDGSIVSPSSSNGIVGIKPTVGVVSGRGIVPISHTQDTAGPMSRTVTDAAILLAAMTGDGSDPLPDPASLRGARVGVARNLAEFDPRVVALFEEALEALRDAGAELIDPTDVPHATEFEEPEWEVLKYEFKADLEAYLAPIGGEAPRTLADLIAFNRGHSAQELPFFAQETFEMSVEKGPLTDPAYLDALETCRRLSRDEGLDAVIAEHALDAIVAPTRGPAWLTDHINGDHHGLGGSSSPAAVSGYPSVTLPMGSVAGLPVGLSFIGGPRRERDLIGYAFAFERSANYRAPPRFLATADPSLPPGSRAPELT
jgi:amidase